MVVTMSGIMDLIFASTSLFLHALPWEGKCPHRVSRRITGEWVESWNETPHNSVLSPAVPPKQAVQPLVSGPPPRASGSSCEKQESSAGRLRRSPPGLTPLREVDNIGRLPGSLIFPGASPLAQLQAECAAVPLVPPLARGCDHSCGLLKPKS